MSGTADLVVVGGGPAGAAAAIAARLAGLDCVLFEAAAEPRETPGDTLHPGVAPILARLGVLEGVEALSQLRPSGQRVAWGPRKSLEAYGADARGDWRAYQVLRRDFDRLLLERYTSLGGRLVRPCRGIAPILQGERVTGVTMSGCDMTAPVTIDASGKRGFLRHHLAIEQTRVSPPLVAWFGYRRGGLDVAPTLEGDGSGWQWTAQVGHERIAWVSLPFHRSKAPPSPPDRIASLPAIGRCGAADVTWRLTDPLCGPGWFVVGEAACVLDPASSHGVLRALMSGMMAAHVARRLKDGATTQDDARNRYRSWLRTWFEHDAARLADAYHELGVDWAWGHRHKTAINRRSV